jgi:subtilisin-like proprotein convertase family protein
MLRYSTSALLALGIAVATANAQTYNNGAAITIPDSGNAAPYPSIINVVGGPASITNVTVTLNNISHTYTGDVAAVLVGPQFQKVALLGFGGGSADFTNNTLTFSDGGVPWVPNSTNAFLPTGYGGSIPGPAPAGPYGSQLSAFNGTNSNGAWLLYIFDGAGGDSGSVAGGWSITFNSTLGTGTPNPTNNLFTYQGKLDNNGTPLTGSVDIIATLYRNGGTADVGALAAQEVDGVQVTNGLFTTTFDFGNAVFDDKDLFLGFQVRNPSGAGSWVTLNGRQRVTPAPASQWASNAGASSSVRSPNFNVPAITTDNAGNVFMGGATGPIGAGNFILNGSQGTGAGFYGGMYITTPDPNGLPFYGYSTSAATCWTYLEPSDQMWRHSWGLALSSAGNMGIGSDPVAGFKLAVNGALRCVGFTNASSQRYKTDVQTINDGVLDRFTQLRPVTFVWNDQAPPDVRGQKTTGLIAEEVFKLFPEAVSLDTQGRPDGIDYSRVTALSIKALKEMRAQQEVKDQELAALKARLEAIEKALQK